MIIKIIVPEYVEKKVQKELFKHIKSLCWLLSDTVINVEQNSNSGEKE